MLTKSQIKDLYIAIDNNYEWTKTKGCTVSDHPRFIKIIIGRFCNLNLEEISVLFDEIAIGDNND